MQSKETFMFFKLILCVGIKSRSHETVQFLYIIYNLYWYKVNILNATSKFIKLECGQNM